MNTRAFLTEVRDGWATVCAPAIGERFVLRNGKEFVGRKKPKRFKQGQPKNCFQNTTHLVTDDIGLRYVEGYVTRDDLPIPILHAWAIDAKNRVIDITLKEPEKYHYMGVVVTRKELYKELHRNKVYGLFDHGLGMNVDWMFRRDPGLKDEIEPLMIVRRGKFRDTDT